MKSQISTQSLSRLPEVESLKKLLQSLAVLDAIMSPEWDLRYYSFNSKWSTHEQMGSMRNGSGDEFFAFFNRAGCFIKGFDHESVMSPYRTRPPTTWPGLLDGIPDVFSSAVNEPAFSMNEITFCIWRRYSDDSWSHGPIDFPIVEGPDSQDPDGSAKQLAVLDGDPTRYQQFAEDYYEAAIPIDSICHIYKHLALTKKVVSSLNPDITLADLADDIAEIGYTQTRSR